MTCKYPASYENVPFFDKKQILEDDKYRKSSLPKKKEFDSASRLVNSSRKQSLCIPLKKTARLMPL
jgi:hypothetical protein